MGGRGGHHALDPPALREEAQQLAALGVTWLSVRLPSPDRAAFRHNAERFANEVISRLSKETRALARFRLPKRVQRRSKPIPAASLSHVVGVTPSSRSTRLSTRPMGLRGSSARSSM